MSPNDIAEQILDLSKWSEFEGYGPLPGIRSAEFKVRTDSVAGSKVRVKNRDGSIHYEEIITWIPEERIVLKMTDFPRPLFYLSDCFEEEWLFDQLGDSQTRVVRKFRLFPKHYLFTPVLWLISRLLRKAIENHLEKIATK